MTAVRRRLVYYISGYDPRGPDHYHALYRDEAARQDALTGAARTVGPITRVDRHEDRWSVSDARGTACEVRFLRYDDLIRRYWPRSPAALWRAVPATAWNLWRWGVLRRVRAQSLRVWYTMTFPLAMVAALPLPPPLLCAAGWWTGGGDPASAVGGAAVGALASWMLWRRIVRIHADWLARICIFHSTLGRGRVPEFDGRLSLFGERIADGLADPGADEVLVVGHSVGTSLAVAALGRALRTRPSPRAAVGLLTLGQCIPLVGLLPNGSSFREDLARVAGSPRAVWLDVSSPTDGAGIALRDPVAGCGLPATGSPKLRNARFYRQFTPARYRVVRRDRFRIHFQYLMAAETAGGFDYIEATAGPLPFHELASAAD